MYVFLNGFLVSQSSIPAGNNKNMGDIHTERTITFNPDSYAGATMADMASGSNYKISVFYAHRSNSNTPRLGFSFKSPALCNANSTNIIDKTLNPFSASNLVPTGKARIDSPDQLQLTQAGQNSFTSALWTSQLKRLKRGFVTTFNFRVNGGSTFSCHLGGRSLAGRLANGCRVF